VLFNIVPRDPPVHYYALCAIQKMHFIVMLVFYNAHFAWPPAWAI